MVDVSIVVDDSDYTRIMGRLVDRLDPTELAKFLRGSVVPHIHTRVASRFLSEGDDASGKWQPLRTATQKIRRSQGYPPAHPINVRTGDLRAFLNGSAGTVSTLTGEARLDFPGHAPPVIREKLKTAQMGRAKPRTVARPVLALSLRDQNAIARNLANHLLGGL